MLISLLFLLLPVQGNCDSFLIKQRLIDNMQYKAPPHKVQPYRRLKLSLRTGLNKDETSRISSRFSEKEEYDLEDIMDEVDFNNLFKFSFRYRYKFIGGTKIYLQDQMKGRSHTVSIGVILKKF